METAPCLEYLLAVYNQLALDGERAGHLASAHFGYDLVGLRVDHSHQRRAAVLHDDVNRVGAERLQAGETPRLHAARTALAIAPPGEYRDRKSSP